ncbi:MAG: glycosyltransferase [Deltaproteobacteria bacterium]|nr:glycosyltransferase [Deltaproteobacteria bacterium]
MNASITKDDSQRRTYQNKRIQHWTRLAKELESRRSLGRYYHHRTCEVLRFHIAPNQRILEVGCGPGDLLSALAPVEGVGVDFCAEMLRQARVRHPHLRFVDADAHDLKDLDGPFDAIIMSDLVNDLWDVQTTFEAAARVSHPKTRLYINWYSKLWELPLQAAAWLQFSKPMLEQNWLTGEDISDLLCLSGFEVMRRWNEILWPIRTPGIDTIVNRVLVKLWPFYRLALTNFIIARPIPVGVYAPPRVSVVVPARNEAGNIREIFERTPTMGRETELVFVEGHSTDDTYAAIQVEMTSHPDRKSRLFRQGGIGKADAVRLGFAHAEGDLLMILDADVTVDPEQLVRFYEAAVSGKAELVNGVRFVYPMEKEAMRFANLIGNKFFSLTFTWLLGQPVKDTLCGTKVIWKEDYEKIVDNRAFFGDFDPFGDFDLLFGAARLGLKIIDIPVRYGERKYGTTSISRWRHGLLLLRMMCFAAKRIKFV